MSQFLPFSVISVLMLKPFLVENFLHETPFTPLIASPMKLLIFWILAAGLALATDTPELNRTVNGWPEQRPVRRQGPVEPAAFLDAQVELSDLHLGPSPRDEKVDALAALRILYSGASPHGPAASDGSPHSVRPIPESLLIKGQIAVKGNDAYSHPRVYGRVSQFARPFPLLTDGTTVESIFRAWNVPFGGLSPLKEESVQFHQSWLKSLPRSYETYFTIAKTIRMGLVYIVFPLSYYTQPRKSME